MAQISGIVLSGSACSILCVPTPSVVDRHRFDANLDPDQNFHVDADQDPGPDPDWHQNDADPQADATPSFTHVGQFFCAFSLSFASLQSFYLSHQCQRCRNLKYLESVFKFFGKSRVHQIFHMPCIDTNPDPAK